MSASIGVRHGTWPRLRGLGAAAALLLLTASVASAATQTVLGRSFVVRNPSPGGASERTVVVSGRGTASDAALVGDPLANGATLQIIANGAMPTRQSTLVLPPGPYARTSRAGWKVRVAGGATTYTYIDKRGTNGPVRFLTIRHLASAGADSIEFRALLTGKLGPIAVAPPNPGTDGGAIFSINGGDRYCVAFGGAAGGDVSVRNDAGQFKIGRATRAGCPAAPNIIVISTDDQRWDTVQYMPITLERIAERGVTFSNAFATTSLCTPSRVTFLTGQYAHHTGVTANFRVRPGLETSTIPVWLQNAGYRTGLYGKYHPRPTNSTPPGWDDWQAWGAQGSTSYTLTNNGNPVSYGPAEDDYLTDVLARKAVEFINAPDDRPFFIYLATYAPHTEGLNPPVPAPRHAGAFAHLPPWRPPSYLEADVSDKPAWIQGLPIDFSFRVAVNDVIRSAQIEALQAVDEAVGSIVDAVEAKGESGNTVIIYTSDNGQTWGEHRLLFTKNVPYEESARVPLIIRYPRLTSAPRSAPELVTNVDLGPTIAAIAGIDPTGPVDGESLVPILTGQPATWRTDVLHEGWFAGHPAIGFASVRTAMWKYTEYGNGETELYDLVNDPDELVSVAADPLHESTITSLRSRLQALRQ